MSNVVDLDIERDAELNRRMDSALVVADAEGRLLIQYVASYERPDGARQMIGFWAHSRADAAERLEAMKRSLTFEGAAGEFNPVAIGS